MDSLETLAFARSLIDIDSTTGREAEAGQWLAGRLAALGYNVLEQKIARGCANVLATIDDPVVVFSTHFDCVPPFIPSGVRDGRLFGRGSCDAKGILAAQLAAAERLRAAGERRVGLLFVAGEERGSDGALAANQIPNNSRFLVNGEPTDSRLAEGTRGVLRVKLAAEGRASHSAAPEHGVSAIDKLLDAGGGVLFGQPDLNLISGEVQVALHSGHHVGRGDADRWGRRRPHERPGRGRRWCTDEHGACNRRNASSRDPVHVAPQGVDGVGVAGGRALRRRSARP